jgi:hypothetical protein
MKTFFTLILSLVICVTVNAQNFKLSAQKQIISIHLNEDNSNKIVKISTADRIANVQRLSIRSLSPEADAGALRTFQITEGDGDAKISFTDDKEAGVFNYSLKEIVDKMGKGTFKLYTISIPKDVAKAAELKPKRVLVATLVIE